MDFPTLTAGDAALTLAPDLGGAILSWTRGERHILRPPLPGAVADKFVRGLAAFPLVPYSNRIAAGRFRFAGIDYQLPATFGGNAIHGVGWQVAWRFAQADATHATLSFDHAPDQFWPFAFRAEQRLSLAPDALEYVLRVENRHGGPAPFGLGLHPFFPRAPGATLQFAADAVWHNRPDMIPDRRTPVPQEWDHTAPRLIGNADLDNCFAGWKGEARIVYPGDLTITISADPVFRHLVVFVPPKMDFFAVEPVTNMNDGINRMDDTPDNGVSILQPDEILTGRILFRLAAP